MQLAGVPHAALHQVVTTVGYHLAALDWSRLQVSVWGQYNHTRGRLSPFGRYPALCDVVTLTSALHASLDVLFAGCDYREDY